MGNNFENRNNSQENPLKELALGAIPIYGTYLDYQKFKKDPSLENFGWMAISGIGDALTFVGGKQAVMALKAARAAKQARALATTNKAIKYANSVDKFLNTREARILGNTTSKEVQSARQSMIQLYNNYKNSLPKLQQSSQNYNQQIVNGVKQMGNGIGFDSTINGLQLILEK